jgi:hypothetical protein
MVTHPFKHGVCRAYEEKPEAGKTGGRERPENGEAQA